MGRRKQRKRNRRIERRDRISDAQYREPADEDSIEEMFFGLFDRPLAERESAASCGHCREFIEDGELGRGTCLHPASGVFSPWNDTPACPYFARGSRMR